ncbi:SIS domain-containing protein [Spirulina major]|uniref:SIS domain-containing protein n=1 Tax=Spirulina major TaxID=270636 RepID=UPI0009335A9E|nr:SIS domain-containing protein [Spirulina major]
MKNYINNYVERLHCALNQPAMDQVPLLAAQLRRAWQERKCIYLCGNGGSAGNAVHLANDFIYGAGMKAGVGLKVEALSANPAVLTCLGNDLGYDQIYAQQLRVKGEVGDVLIVLSGSGNSANVVQALNVADELGMVTCAILGFDGGMCKTTAQIPIHFAVNDMQIAEDIQLVVGHICMQWLCEVIGEDAASQKDKIALSSLSA